MFKRAKINFINRQIMKYQHTHIPNLTISTNENESPNMLFKLLFDRNGNLTRCVINPFMILTIINANFTIFERIFYGNKLYISFVQTIMSTIYNIYNAKHEFTRQILLDYIYMYRKGRNSEQEVIRDIILAEDILDTISTIFVPNNDICKYLVDPSNGITNVKLGNIFSTIINKLLLSELLKIKNPARG